MSANNRNLGRSAKQAISIGNTNPPNSSAIKDSLLKAASPAGFSLLDNTKIIKNSSDTAADKCRTYKDVTGLRQLIKDQQNNTYYEPGCGWRYKPSNGLYPEINQGALGTADGPSVSNKDEVSGGTQWFWDLEKAEKTITTKICQNASQCNQLSLMGNYADICGYCKSTKAVIPIMGGAARYKNDTSLTCARGDIVTVASGTCPEGFIGRPIQGNLHEAFQVREGFGSLDSLNNCMEMPLSRDCVIMAAQNAGCSDEGTLIQSLQGSGSGNYDTMLKSKQSYKAYTGFSPFTNGLLQDGSVASINTALTDFGKLMSQTTSQNQKVALSAKDLCVRAGEFDNYDFCSEMSPDTVINSGNIACVQKLWLQGGGTEQGTVYPTLDTFNGKRFIEFLIPAIVTLIDTNSDEKDTNTKSIRDIVGTDSSAIEKRVGVDLPMDNTTRGAETVWFDLTNVSDPNSPTVIYRCDLSLRKDIAPSRPNGEVLPFFRTTDELVNTYNFTNADNKAYTSAFEIRIPNDQVRFYIKTDDGFMLSKNQNPFEKAGNGPDWGSWKYQGPTEYVSPEYQINEGKPNMFVTKWFQGGGQSTAEFNYQRKSTGGWYRCADSSDIYLTQEPLAPWMQYEICKRPNNGRGTAVGFFEKRWNGPSAVNQDGSSKSGFDVENGSVVFQTDRNLLKNVPGGKGYMSFVSNSYWHTKAYFHFNAFKTITLLIRPSANLANGGVASVFHHCNFAGYSAGCYLKNTGGRYTLAYGTSKNQFQRENDVTPNEWNLIVIQYVGNEAGVRNITIHVEKLTTIQQDSGKALLSKLSAGRTSGGSIVIGNPRGVPLDNAGMLILGAWNRQIYPNAPGGGGAPSFTGDIAWIHGFRDYLDSDQVIKNEINQTWVSRWPIPNLPADAVEAYSYKGCYRDTSNRALANRLGNVGSVEECGKNSKAAGLNTFGLQFYGECWAGNNSDWDKYGRLNDNGCGTLGTAWNNQVYKHN
jgi:hypothetical protein